MFVQLKYIVSNCDDEPLFYFFSLSIRSIFQEANELNSPLTSILEHYYIVILYVLFGFKKKLKKYWFGSLNRFWMKHSTHSPTHELLNIAMKRNEPDLIKNESFIEEFFSNC